MEDSEKANGVASRSGKKNLDKDQREATPILDGISQNITLKRQQLLQSWEIARNPKEHFLASAWFGVKY